MNDETDYRSKDPNSASAFYCNMEALSPADRARHQSVTRQLKISVKVVEGISYGLALCSDTDDQSIILASEFVVAVGSSISLSALDRMTSRCGCIRMDEEGGKEYINPELGV